VRGSRRRISRSPGELRQQFPTQPALTWNVAEICWTGDSRNGFSRLRKFETAKTASDGPLTEPTHNPDEIDPLLRDALAWVVRLRSGEATKTDLAVIRQWRAQSADHEEAFRQAALLWRDLKVTADAVTETGSRRVPLLKSFNPRHWSTTRRAFIGGAVAASAAAYVAYNPPMQLWPSLNELAADYRTGKGERKDVVVAEGVSISLNTLTSIALRSSEQGSPRLELITGEAAVTADRVASRPLVLQALGARVVATRASFNARCLDGSVSVTCLDGRLDVEQELGLVQLEAGQQVTFLAKTGLGMAVAVDAKAASAWQQNLLVVHDRPLAEVVNEVNRYRAGRIIITNTALGRRLVSGTFHTERLDNFPNQVHELFGARLNALPGNIVLLS